MQNQPYPDLKFFIQEASSRLYVALEVLEYIDNEGEDTKRSNGYERTMLREIIEDVAAALARASEGPDQPEKGK